MELKRNGSRPSQKGPSEYFMGNVRIDPIVQAPEPSRVTAGWVTFEPGALELAYAPTGPDPRRRVRLGLDAMRRRSDRGNPPR